MVAEAVKEQEEVQVPGATPEVPEPPSEPTAPADEEVDELAEVLSAFVDAEPGNEAATGNQAGTANADPYAGLTPQQIEERGAERVRSRLTQTSRTDAEQAALNGTRQSLNDSKATLKSLLSGLDAETQLQLVPLLEQKLDEFHGSHLRLRNADAQEAHTQGVHNVKRGIYEGVASALGKDVADDLLKANHQTWDAYLADVGEHYATQKGFVSKAEVKEKYVSRETVKTQMSRINEALKSHNLSLAAITGNGGTTALPQARGGSSLGVGMPSGLKQYTDATFDQRMAWQKADPEIELKLIEKAAGQSA